MKLVLGLCWAITVLGVLGIVLFSSDPERHAQKQKPEATPYGQNGSANDIESKERSYETTRWRKYKEKIERNEKFITATSTIFIAAFTILLAFATAFLYFATRDLVESADKNSEKQLRAYIGIQSMETTVYPFEKGGYAYIAHAELRNFGQTPAYDLTVQANSAVDLPDAIPFDDTQGPAKAAGAGIAYRDVGFHIRQSKFINEDDKNAILNRTKNVFLWGTVRYRDAFNKKHFFTFRLINAELTIGGGGGVYAMAPHPLGYEEN